MTGIKRKTIFALCRELGLDESARHVIQKSITGKESLSKINDQQADDIIRCLRAQQQKNGYDIEKSLRPGVLKNRRVHSSKIYNLASKEQRNKIIAMSIKIYGEFIESKMDVYCNRRFNKPFKRISSNEAIKLIEAQKIILERKKE
ncbi:MAG: DUF1018 domain-containing protein [Spirochaetes bacterium]|nr:DUF1018 domain-containing protein [Spirochaetota bacterium]MBN2771239.1 DUF1018 domain-containing protein [Spirochaetota bacterium]